jgi:hypothetical protein
MFLQREIIMARIIGIDGMTHDELNNELAQGARFVTYQYCISVIIMSFRRGSNIHFIRNGESAVKRGLGFVALTAALGWWGIPWGPIFSIQSLATNLGGGKDVTDAVLKSLNRA